jgi:predicted Zn-dependent protease
MLDGNVLELSESRTHFRDLEPQRLAARGANLLGALAAEPGKEELAGDFIVMSPEASAQVLKEFAPGLTLGGEARGRGAAAPRLSIIDNPLLDGQPGSAPFDDEGAAVAEKYLVNKGVAVAAAADIRTAFARGGTSTGNGFRDERDIFPQVRFSNLFIRPSNEPLVGLLRQARRGALVCLVKSRGGGRSLGERLFSAHGYSFADGEVAQPVHFHFAASMRSYLLHVQAVSRELRFFNSRANIGSPYLLLQGRRDAEGNMHV